MNRIILIASSSLLSLCLGLGLAWAQGGANPTCEEQLGQVINALAFVRSGRQQIEDTAGSVTSRLQKQIEALEHQLNALKKAQPPAPPVDTEKGP